MSWQQDNVTSSAAEVLNAVRDKTRLRHLSIRTELAYTQWIARFARFNAHRNVVELGPSDVEHFLTHLAVERGVASSTQNQAKAALLFLDKEVLARPLPWLENVTSARPSRHVPLVLSRREVARILSHMSGTHRLIAAVLYGSGMRLLEGLRLRIKDVDFSYRQITIRNGKGAKDRITLLPTSLQSALEAHISRVRELHA